ANDVAHGDLPVPGSSPAGRSRRRLNLGAAGPRASGRRSVRSPRGPSRSSSPSADPMRPVDRPLLVLHSDSGFRARVAAACLDEYVYQEVADWDELEEAVREAPPSAMVLVDPLREAGQPEERLNALLRAFPST